MPSWSGLGTMDSLAPPTSLAPAGGCWCWRLGNGSGALSPCAYVCGLLHPLVIEELDLLGRGLEWHPAMSGLFVPFEDGSSVQLWGDDERLEAEIRRFAPKDLGGWRTMSALKAR